LALGDPTLSPFRRTPTCDRETDRHITGIYRASIASRSRIAEMCFAAYLDVFNVRYLRKLVYTAILA